MSNPLGPKMQRWRSTCMCSSQCVRPIRPIGPNLPSPIFHPICPICPDLLVYLVHPIFYSAPSASPPQPPRSPCPPSPPSSPRSPSAQSAPSAPSAQTHCSFVILIAISSCLSFYKVQFFPAFLYFSISHILETIFFLYFLLINFIVSTTLVDIIFIINLRTQCFTSIIFPIFFHICNFFLS